MTRNEQNVVKGQGFLGNSQHVQHSVTGFMLRVDFTRFARLTQAEIMNAGMYIMELPGRRKPSLGAYVTPSMALHTGLLHNIHLYRIH